MGSIERADEIASSIPDPTMSTMTKHVYTSCGNCGLRIECANEVIDVKQAIAFLSSPDELDVRGRPSLAARTIAQIFAERYAQSPHLKGYIIKFATSDPKQAEELAEALKKMPRDKLELLIWAILMDQGITTLVFISRITRLWMKCEREKKFTTVIEMMKG